MSSTEKKHILSAARTVTIATLTSRLLGAPRDMVIAWFFPPAVTDAFFVAFRLPNLMRRLFGEGALTVSILPVFTEVLHRDPEEAKRVYKITTALLTLILTIIVALGMVFSKYIVWIFAPGFFSNPEKAALTIKLTMIMFPFLLLISLVALAQGVLNALGHFLAPAVAPAVLNVFMIAGVVWLSNVFPDPIYGLVIGVLVGGAVEVLMQIPYLVKRGYTPGMIFDFKHPAVRKILFLMGPAAFGMLVYQFNMLISTIFASLLPEGSVSWLFYSQRFTELPLGLFAVAIGTAILPSLSRQMIKGDIDGLKDSYRFALRIVLFLMAPCAAGLCILSVPIFSTFYQRGAFSHDDSLMSAYALLAYAPGLIAIACTRVTTPVFYARQNTKTPVKIATIAFGVNLAASFFLMGPHYVLDPILRYFYGQSPLWRPAWLPVYGFDSTGLAFATTISSWYNFVALIINLRKQIGPFGARTIVTPFLKTVAACIPMCIVSSAAAWFGWADWIEGGMSFKNLSTLFVSVSGGALAFIAAAWFMKLEEITVLFDSIRRRFAASRPNDDLHSLPPKP